MLSTVPVVDIWHSPGITIFFFRYCVLLPKNFTRAHAWHHSVSPFEPSSEASTDTQMSSFMSWAELNNNWGKQEPVVHVLCSVVSWSRLLFKTGSLNQVAQDLAAFWVCSMSMISQPLWAPSALNRAIYVADVECGAKHSSHIESAISKTEALWRRPWLGSPSSRQLPLTISSFKPATLCPIAPDYETSCTVRMLCSQLPGDTMEGPAGSLAAGLLPRVLSRQDLCQLQGCTASTSLAVIAPTLRNALQPPLQCSLRLSAVPSVKARYKTSLSFPAGMQSLTAHSSVASSSALPSRRQAQHHCDQTQFSGALVAVVTPHQFPTACCVLAKIIRSWHPVYTGSKSEFFCHQEANKYCEKQI